MRIIPNIKKLAKWQRFVKYIQFFRSVKIEVNFINQFLIKSRFNEVTPIIASDQMAEKHDS